MMHHQVGRRHGLRGAVWKSPSTMAPTMPKFGGPSSNSRSMSGAQTTPTERT